MDGRELSQVVTQPKRFALLTFLSAHPGMLHRRDTLLALLWPDADATRGRAALRNSLYFLRSHLGADAILTRGSLDVGVNPDRLWFDAWAFEAAARDGRAADALDLFGGAFLPGFFVTGAAPFEEWLEERRAWYQKTAVRAALSVSEGHESQGHLAEAVHASRRALELAPYDEAVFRRLVRLLDTVGDRAGVLADYAVFRGRLERELEVTPSPETHALIERVRLREARLGDAASNIPVEGPQPDVVAAFSSDPGEARGHGARTGRRRFILAAGAVGASVLVLLLGNATGGTLGWRTARPGTASTSEVSAIRHWHKRTFADYWEAVRLLERVIDGDPGNAEAYAWLSNTWGAMAVYGYVRPSEAFRRASAAAQRSLELDPGLAAGHAAKGAVHFLYDRDWEAAERELLHAIALDGQYAEAHNVLAHLYRALGRFDESLAEAHLAALHDPLAPYFEHHIGIVLFCSRRDQEAIVRLRQAVEWEPGPSITRRMLVGAWVRMGEPDSALAAWVSLSRRGGRAEEADLLTAGSADGFSEAAAAVSRWELDDLVRRAEGGEFVAPVLLARAHARAGNRDAALESLLHAVEVRDPQALYLRCDPDLDVVRDDPRFRLAEQRLGLPPTPSGTPR